MAELVFNCPHCGGAVQCDSQFSGQTVNCPLCQGGIIVPAEEPAAAPGAEAGGAAACISCGAPLEQGAVLCMQCGMNQETGVSVLPAAEEKPAPQAESTPEPQVEKPAEAPAEEPAETPVLEPEIDPAPAGDDEALIFFDCPGCGQELEIPESMIGDAVGCPDCGVEVTSAVPMPKPQTGSKKVLVKKKTIMPIRKGGK